ncbi:MAG: gluconate 2-dehydrogenase subunit 3 family protein [Agriterribacter sp.]
MKRRSAIKNLMIIAGGIAIMPSCSNEPGKASIELKNLPVNAEQEALLADIAEAIIPKDTIPGAKDLKLHLFTLKMVDDCETPEAQKLFLSGLAAVDVLAKDKYGNAFTQCTPKQKMELLDTISKKDSASKEASAFIGMVKHRVTQGFMNSKLVMTDLKKYELVPGRYNGYFKV